MVHCVRQMPLSLPQSRAAPVSLRLPQDDQEGMLGVPLLSSSQQCDSKILARLGRRPNRGTHDAKQQPPSRSRRQKETLE